MVGNALGREACELITKNESPLLDADLADMINAHFQDVLGQMVELRRDAEDDGSVDDGEGPAPDTPA